MLEQFYVGIVGSYSFCGIAGTESTKRQVFKCPWEKIGIFLWLTQFWHKYFHGLYISKEESIHTIYMVYKYVPMRCWVFGRNSKRVRVDTRSAFREMNWFHHHLSPIHSLSPKTPKSVKSEGKQESWRISFPFSKTYKLYNLSPTPFFLPFSACDGGGASYSYMSTVL